MDLQHIIQQLDQLKEELDKLRPIRADHLNKLNQKLQLEWNYHSNSMEGNTLSKSETKAFMLWGITAKGKPFRDYLEMHGHQKALKQLFEIVRQEILITENLIKSFHKMILVEPYADSDAEVNPGEWKRIPNYLYSPVGERIDFLPPEEVPRLMNELINWLNNHLHPPKRKKKKYDLHPLLVAEGFHVQFLNIHPFGDGNGRMARILTNLILMRCGYTPAIIQLTDRVPYYTAINTRSLNEPEQLAMLLGEAVCTSLKWAIQAAKGLPLEKEEDWQQKLDQLNESLTKPSDSSP